MERPAVARLAISNHGLRAAGGIERYGLTIVRGLHDRGVRPTLIAKVIDRTLPEAAFVDPVVAGVGAVPGKLRDFAFDWRIGRAKRRLGLFPLIGLNQTRWSDIAICGGTHPGFLAAMGREPGTIDRWKIALERAHFENAAVVVAHAQRMEVELLRHYAIDATKIVRLYPPVDTARFAPVAADERARLRKALDLPGDRAVFLLASTGHARKGLARLADRFAATHLPATLVVAGRPPERSLPNVRFLGYRTDLENVYRAVDFTVLASTYEPFGLVGVESVLCGTPVLLADSAGCAEVIREPAGMRFAVDDPASLDRAMRRAVARWQGGETRLAEPLGHLSYDPDVGVHVDALLSLGRRLVESR